MTDTLTSNKPELAEGIIITAKAAKQIGQIRRENNIPETHGLRVGVKGGGCSGFSYVLGFDSEAREGDRIIESEGIRIFIDPKSLMYLTGTQLDFQDDLNGKGFVFTNPNATRTCGCGQSFSV
ncbi:MAG: iron-sulfur cluster insertion protein ErpA [Ignavibacteriae bacterium]|nr:iron-sulfur cluster insertion protein ErpA [Ignavibacteriota bacterium]